MWNLQEATEYYRSQGAPGDQQMLIALLREVQQETGPLTQQVLTELEAALDLKPSLLPALIRRVPSLRMAAHPHRLEICQNCGKKLALWVENEYGVQSGGACDAHGFTFHLTGCMKNCKAPPSVRWDGVLHPGSSEETLRKLIHSKENA